MIMKFNSLIDPKKRQQVLDAIAKGDPSLLKRNKPGTEPPQPEVEKPTPQPTPKMRDPWLDAELIKAAAKGDLAGVKSTLRCGADMNSKDKCGQTALMEASWHGNKEIVELLIASGADVNAKDNEGATALMRASHLRNNDIIELLKKHGAKE